MNHHLLYRKIGFILLFNSILSLNAQSYLEYGIGLHLNRGVDNWEEFGGGGFSISVGYRNEKINYLYLEFRTKFQRFTFKNKDWEYENDYTSFHINSPSVGIAPRIQFQLAENIKLFIENEFVYNFLCVGSSKNEFQLKKSYLFSYIPSIGIKNSIGKAECAFSIGYSTLNFGKMLNKSMIYEMHDLSSLKPDLVLAISFYFIDMKL